MLPLRIVPGCHALSKMGSYNGFDVVCRSSNPLPAAFARLHDLVQLLCNNCLPATLPALHASRPFP